MIMQCFTAIARSQCTFLLRVALVIEQALVEKEEEEGGYVVEEMNRHTGWNWGKVTSSISHLNLTNLVSRVNITNSMRWDQGKCGNREQRLLQRRFHHHHYQSHYCNLKSTTEVAVAAAKTAED